MDVLAAIGISSDLEVAYYPDFTKVTTSFVDWCGISSSVYQALKPLGLICQTHEEARQLAKKMLASIAE